MGKCIGDADFRGLPWIPAFSARGLGEFLLPAWAGQRQPMRATEIRPTRDIREDPRPMVLLCNVAAGSVTMSQWVCNYRLFIPD
jgi:hypothetical protein